MKKIIAILVILLTIGCGDKLNTNTYTEVSENNAKTNRAKILTGMYGLIGSAVSIQNGVLLNDQGALYGTDLILIGDLLGGSDYVDWLGTFNDYGDINRLTTAPNNGVVFRVWRKAYKAINQANILLENTGGSDYYKAQAYFVRGIMHFELVKLWGQYKGLNDFSGLGIPLSLSATNSYEQVSRPARATMEQTYNQIISDLLEAKKLIVAEIPSDVEGDATMANIDVVKAYLARVYMQNGRFQDALDNLPTSITPSIDVKEPFNQSNLGSSVIFTIPQDAINNAGTTNDGLTTFYGCDASIPASAGRGDVSIDTLFYSNYEATDKRFTQLIYFGGDCNLYTSKKWFDPFAYIPLIRSEELLLMRAECNFRLGTGTPLNDINQIRARAGATTLSSLTLNDILKERQLELAFEGHRIHDLKRFEVAPYLEKEYILPIPQADINTNPNLIQNP